MSKFKFGDKVRCIKKSEISISEDYGVVGREYTVVSQDGVRLVLKELREGRFGLNSTRFELVEKSKNPLVETVTRKVTRTIEEEVTEKKLIISKMIINNYICFVDSDGCDILLYEDRLDETIDALIAVRDHWREIGKIK